MTRRNLTGLREKSNNELSRMRQSLIVDQLTSHLSQIFGYHALLYTQLAKTLCAENLSIKHQVVIENSEKNLSETSTLFCSFNELPIASDTIDLAILPNILQNASNPHQVLREVERVLIPEGVVILIGRNPYSWHGLKTVIKRIRKKKKPIVSDLSKRRIADWFELLGFETEKELNISVTHWRLKNSQFYPWISQLADYFCSWFCSYYIIIASKKVSTLTPIRPSWRSNKQLVPPRMAEPSVRSQVESMFQRVK